MTKKNVVLLVDDKRRDLMVASLMALQLRRRGIECHLEPLEAYQGCLAAYHPDLIIFNHITASHLVNYSKRLGDMGVMTAVLLNEGLCYDDDERYYNAGKHHRGAHIDRFFCWNEMLKKDLVRNGVSTDEQVVVVGPPRYDFYSQPWSGIFTPGPWKSRGRPKVLFCTNFGLARYFELPKKEAEKFFAAWKDRIPIYRDYWSLVEVSHNGAVRFFDFLRAAVAANKYDIVLRPHPRENHGHYHDWLKSLPEETRKWVRIDADSNITSLILDCDIQIACENCNTSLEAWIAHKPAVELLFDKHPVFYSKDVADLNAVCDNPAALPIVLDRELASPDQPALRAGRDRHLARWCNSPSGKSCEMAAESIAAALAVRSAPDWSKLTITDHRRALKLKMTQQVGEAYHYDPLLFLKGSLFKTRYNVKRFVYRKSIKPQDVLRARAILEQSLGQAGQQPQTH